MPTKKADNLALWNRVEKTDPANTKQVKLGRAFTAIDPHSQIKAMTEQFGPAGNGWGWEVLRVEYTTTNNIAVLIGLWHSRQETGEFIIGIQQWGENSLYIDKDEKRKDIDAFKKATTDGLTKCISYLGFNADVFFGKFDDNKYVQSMDNEFRKAENAEKSEGAKAKADALIKNIEACETKDAIDELRAKTKPTFDEIRAGDKAQAQRVSTAVQKKLAEFPDGT